MSRKELEDWLQTDDSASVLVWQRPAAGFPRISDEFGGPTAYQFVVGVVVGAVGFFVE